MSSTSSSSSQNAYCNSIMNETAPPWYPMLGQPLIYYAQVRPKSRKKDEKKKNSNCFARAFHWYTQERSSKTKSSKVDVNDFASWLDDKYEDFLRNGSSNHNIWDKKSVIKIVKSSCRLEDATFQNETFKENSKGRRSKSRNYFSGKIKSNTKAVEKKLKLKSRSLASILKEREIIVEPFDRARDEKKNNESRSESIIEIYRKNSASNNKRKYKKDISQCTCAKSDKDDTNNRESEKKNGLNISLSDDKDPKHLRKKQVNIETHHNREPIENKSNFVHISKKNNSVQTSSCSINLDIGSSALMKMLCSKGQIYSTKTKINMQN